MEHFWDILFQLTKHGTNTLLDQHFIFLFSVIGSSVLSLKWMGKKKTGVLSNPITKQNMTLSFKPPCPLNLWEDMIGSTWLYSLGHTVAKRFATENKIEQVQVVSHLPASICFLLFGANEYDPGSIRSFRGKHMHLNQLHVIFTLTG